MRLMVQTVRVTAIPMITTEISRAKRIRESLPNTNTSGGVEHWGIKGKGGVFSWRLKIKSEASTREGLKAGSNQPRFDARLDDKGSYINPFTGEMGGRSIGTRIPLGS